MGPDIFSRELANKQTILNHYSFFRDAADSLQHKILSCATTVILQPKSYFFERGTKVRQVALIGSGSVRVYMIGEGGREITLYHVQAGDACPINILSILLDKVTPAFAIAESTVHAVCISADYFKEWVATHTAIRQYAFETFAERFLDMFSLVDNLKCKKLEKRLAEYLVSKTSRQEYAPSVIKLTHESLASELGSAREVVSRLLRKLERKGIVELTRGRIYVNNKQALKNIICE
ncbi:Crp/Fnr family transcriptional regulator [Kaarinaea lacus]